MINVEYVDDGRKVIIPAEVWEALKELAERVTIHEIIEERKHQSAIHSLDDILAEEGLTRGDVEG